MKMEWIQSIVPDSIKVQGENTTILKIFIKKFYSETRQEETKPSSHKPGKNHN